MSYFIQLIYCFRRVALLFVAIPAAVSAQVVSVPDNIYLSVDELWGRVVVANRYYSYEALVTYEANGSLNTLKLFHSVDNRKEHNRVFQRLEFLDGANRHVIREQKLKGCLDGKTRWGLWPSHADVKNLQKFYRVTIDDYERVAGRQTVVMHFVPKDQFRYGYRFNVDVQTGLLLRSLTIDSEKIIERTQFSSLSLIGRSPIPSNDANATAWRVPEVDPCHTEQFQSAWSVGWLPEGFTSAGNRVTAQGEQVLMFTDGMASISVFITSGRYQDVPKITAYRGATVTVISPLSFDIDNSVAVVGEIPAVTARRIAVSIQSQ